MMIDPGEYDGVLATAYGTAKLLNVPPATVQGWVDRGEVATLRVRRSIYLRVESAAHRAKIHHALPGSEATP